jgi:protocatechuate 3,4-dioxygenase beta subunit
VESVGVAATDAASPTQTLAGLVFAEDGERAAGATITVAAVFRSPPLRIVAKADEQGRFQVALPRLTGSKHYDLAARWRRQGADVGETFDATGKSVSIQGQSLPPMTIRLRSGGKLRGKLLRAEDGGPIAGARLFLDTGEVLNTDERGVFEVAGLPMKDHSLIPVAAGQIRQYVLFDTTRRPDAELEVRLPAGATLKGRVVDEQGQPVAGAFVYRASSGTALTLNGWDEPCRPDGSFEYSGLPPGRTYGLQAAAPGFRDRTVSATIEEPNDMVEVFVRLPGKPTEHQAGSPSVRAATEDANPPTAHVPQRTIVGTITDNDGKPLAGATVRWGHPIEDPSGSGSKSDSAGKYTVTAPQAKGTIMVVADGLAPEFAVVGEKQSRVDVKLASGTAVHGVVRGTSGEPISGVLVIPVVQHCETGLCNLIWFTERETRSNDQGRFQIAALPPDARFDFLKEGYSERRNVTLQLGETTNEIRMSAGGAIQGRVVDANGKPVRQFKIRVLIPRKLSADEPAGGYYAGFDWYGITFTRDDGIFVLTDIGANHWMRLIISAPGVGRAIRDRVKSEPLDKLSPAEKLTTPLEPFVPLNVKVVDAASKRAVPNARIGLREDMPDFSRGFNWGYDDRGAVRARTKDGGIATILEPACEDGTILVQAKGCARRRISTNLSAQTVEVSLEPAAALHGGVQLGDRPLVEGYVRLTSATNDTFTADLEETEGRFEFDELPAGEYQLEVFGPRQQSLSNQKLKLETGRVRSLVIDVANGPDKRGNL